MLHAGTPLVVSVHQSSDRVRVDVADGSPTLPTVKAYRHDAATGRGLTLFNRLASSWGARPVPGGKVVWFELPLDVPVDVVGTDDQPPVEVGDWPAPDEAPPPSPNRPKAPTWSRSSPGGSRWRPSTGPPSGPDALFREFRLIVERQPRSSQALPARLLALIDELGTRFAGFSRGADAQWRQALEQGGADRRLGVHPAPGSWTGLRALRPAPRRGRRLLPDGRA